MAVKYYQEVVGFQGSGKHAARFCKDNLTVRLARSDGMDPHMSGCPLLHALSSQSTGSSYLVHTPCRNDCIYTFTIDGVEGAGPLPTGANARAGRARPDQSYLDAGADLRVMSSCPCGLRRLARHRELTGQHEPVKPR